MPCPLCGGLIHPVAGRCKHCKSDLRQLRGSRPAALAPLPPLAPVPRSAASAVGSAGASTAAAPSPPPSPFAAPAANGHRNGATNGHARARGYEPSPSQEPAIPVVSPPSYERTGPQAILPPRVTARHATGTVDEPRSALRHWPIVVIVLAVLAIVAAVVLMVWPPSNDSGKKANPALQGPAPEHMDTSPLPSEPSTAGGRAPQAPTRRTRRRNPRRSSRRHRRRSPTIVELAHAARSAGAKLPLDLNALNNLDLNGPMPTGAAVAVHALQRECRVLRGCGTADERSAR